MFLYSARDAYEAIVAQRRVRERRSFPFRVSHFLHLQHVILIANTTVDGIIASHMFSTALTAACMMHTTDTIRSEEELRAKLAVAGDQV